MNYLLFLFAALLFLGTGRPASGHTPDVDQRLEEASYRVRAGELLLGRNPGDPLAGAELITAYLGRARLAGDWSDVDRAEELLAQIEALAPEHPEVLWVEAELRAYQHRFRASLRAAERLIRVSPTDPRGFTAAGDALLELGNLGAAQARYARMARLQRDFDALVRLARLREAQGDLTQAAQLLQEAIAAAGQDGERRDWARVVLASLEMGRGQLGRAEAILQEALRERHSDAFALRRLADLFVLSGEDERADEFYARAFSIRPDPACAAAWAEVQRRLGRTAAADTLDHMAEQALRGYVSTGREAYLRELATFYLRRNRNPAEALWLARQDLAIRQDTRGLELLAWACRQNNMAAEAWEVIQQALSRPDADAQTHYLAGQIALDLGDEAAAEQWWLKALQVNPARPEARQVREQLRVLREKQLLTGKGRSRRA